MKQNIQIGQNGWVTQQLSPLKIKARAQFQLKPEHSFSKFSLRKYQLHY